MVADNLGFRYLSPVSIEKIENQAVDRDREIRGIIFGNMRRLFLPMAVQSFPQSFTRPPASVEKPALRIVVMYDSGSSLTYLTKEVLERLGFSPDYEADTTYAVRLEGRACTVGLCPRERCEHVCLLGQDFFAEFGFAVEIDFQSRTIVARTETRKKRV
jgi:hypothetical protein